MPKRYPPVFKRDVVTVARHGDLSVNEVAADFDIALESVRPLGSPGRHRYGVNDGLTTAELSSRSWCSCVAPLAS